MGSIIRETKPFFTGLLAESWALAAQTPKPTALGTMLRYSGANGCGRRMGYDWFDALYTEPPTPASIFQAGVGTLVGEAAANAMIAKYGGEAEKPSKVNDWISGSADWFGEDTPVGRVVFEHKMKSSYAFNKAMGYKRIGGKASRVGNGNPPPEAVKQAGMNALGIEATYGKPINSVVVGVVSTEIVSVMQNATLKVDDFARFGAEWSVPRDVWEPMALREIDRLMAFGEMLDLGYLPPRLAVGDGDVTVELDPHGTAWQCNYCPFRSLCHSDGDGTVRVLDSKMEHRTTNEPTEMES